MASCHFCCVVSLRTKTLDPAHTQKEGIKQGHESQEAGTTLGVSPTQYLSATLSHNSNSSTTSAWVPFYYCRCPGQSGASLCTSSCRRGCSRRSEFSATRGRNCVFPSSPFFTGKMNLMCRERLVTSLLSIFRHLQCYPYHRISFVYAVHLHVTHSPEKETKPIRTVSLILPNLKAFKTNKELWLILLPPHDYSCAF